LGTQKPKQCLASAHKAAILRRFLAVMQAALGLLNRSQPSFDHGAAIASGSVSLPTRHTEAPHAV
jgi:hypothetical protein